MKNRFALSPKNPAVLLMHGCSLAGALQLGGCASETDHTQSASMKPALSPAARSLVEQLMKQTLAAAGRVVRLASAQDATAVYTLLGADATQGSEAHLAKPCSEVTPPSGPTCNQELPHGMPFLGMFNTCFVTGCDGANLAWVDVYVTTSSNSSVDERMPLTYPTRAPAPAGTITYDPNPLTRWFTDATDDNAVHIRAELNQNVHAKLEAGPTLDLSYEGLVEGTNAPGNATMTMDLTLSHLIASHTVSVSAQLSGDKKVVGRIVAGETTLGELSESSQDVVWRE